MVFDKSRIIIKHFILLNPVKYFSLQIIGTRCTIITTYFTHKLLVQSQLNQILPIPPSLQELVQKYSLVCLLYDVALYKTTLCSQLIFAIIYSLCLILQLCFPLLTNRINQLIFNLDSPFLIKQILNIKQDMVISIVVCLIIAIYAFKILRRKFCKPDFKGKTIWITGASSGIGQYLAYQFSKRNAEKLILSARNLQQLQRVKNNCSRPDKVQVIKLDMVDFDNVKRITQKVIKDLQTRGMKLDIIVENAGVSQKPDFMNLSFENHLAITDLNVHGPYFHIKCFIDHMIKNKCGQIVGIGSIYSKFTNTNRASYTASKHALLSILDSLRSQLYSNNIKVTSIFPGYIQSNVGKNALMQQEGQKCQIKDSYYDRGMKTDQFAREAVQAIYMGEKQCHISINTIKNTLRSISRGLIPDLGHYLNVYYSKEIVRQNLTAYLSKKTSNR